MKANHVVKAVAMLVLFIIQTAALAQPPSRMLPEERVAELKNELGLNDEQVAAITKIFQAQDEEMRKMFESAAGDRSAMREAMMQKRKETDEKIIPLLNDEQKAKYAEFQKQRRSRFEQRQRN